MAEHPRPQTDARQATQAQQAACGRGATLSNTRLLRAPSSGFLQHGRCAKWPPDNCCCEHMEWTSVAVLLQPKQRCRTAPPLPPATMQAFCSSTGVWSLAILLPPQGHMKMAFDLEEHAACGSKAHPSAQPITPSPAVQQSIRLLPATQSAATSPTRTPHASISAHLQYSSASAASCHPTCSNLTHPQPPLSAHLQYSSASACFLPGNTSASERLAAPAASG